MDSTEEEQEEDIRKMTEVITKYNFQGQRGFDLEFQKFIQNADEMEAVESGSDLEIPKQDISKLDLLPTTLTREELDIIDACEDPELKQLLIINRQKHVKLLLIFKEAKDLLLQIQEEYKQTYKLSKGMKEKPETFVNYCSYKLAAPYFKDEKFYSCPPNDDYYRKKNAGELFIYDYKMPQKWNNIDSGKLLRSVKNNYAINRGKQLNNTIKELERELSKAEEEEKQRIIEDIDRLKEQIEKIDECDDQNVPPLNDCDSIDWYKIADNFRKDKFTNVECKSFWSIYLHPSINTNPWSASENKKLVLITKKHNFQNWEQIALDLNTNRSAFITCVHYFSNIYDQYSREKFSQEEDKLLLKCIDVYRINNYIPWHKIAQKYFKDRSHLQLYHRYTYFLNYKKEGIRSGPFSDAEDVLLLILVDRFGKDFSKCATYMPRSQMQIKCRYNTYFDRDFVTNQFTVEEDEIIWNYTQRHGTTKWHVLAKKLERSRPVVRQRYFTIKKFLDSKPFLKIADAPRKKVSRRKKSQSHFETLRFIANQFKDNESIPSIEMIENSLEDETQTPQINNKVKAAKIVKTTWRKNKLKTIDDLLMDCFSNNIKIKEQKSYSDKSIEEAAVNVKTLLEILGANLEIPNNFENDSNLDVMDKAILKKIINHHPEIESNNCCLIPPSVHTLVGLRGLLITHQNLKDQKKNENIYSLYDLPQTSSSSENQILWSFEQYLAQLDENSRQEILRHRELFSKRIVQLFHWSSILSDEKPNINNDKRISQVATPQQISTDKRVADDVINDKIIKKRKTQHFNKDMNSVPKSSGKIEIVAIESGNGGLNRGVKNENIDSVNDDDDDTIISNDIAKLDFILNMPSCSTNR